MCPSFLKMSIGSHFTTSKAQRVQNCCYKPKNVRYKVGFERERSFSFCASFCLPYPRFSTTLWWRVAHELTGWTACLSSCILRCPHPMQVHPQWHWLSCDCQIYFAQLALPLQLLKHLLSVLILGQHNTATNTRIDAMTNQWTRHGCTTNGSKGAE